MDKKSQSADENVIQRSDRTAIKCYHGPENREFWRGIHPDLEIVVGGGPIE